MTAPHTGSAGDLSHIEWILEMQVEIAQTRFEALKLQASRDGELADARLSVLDALNRLSAFVLQGVVPEELA